MNTVNVYKLSGEMSEFVEEITPAERDARVAAMQPADEDGMPTPYAYRDASGQIWGFAEAKKIDKQPEEDNAWPDFFRGE